MKVLIVEDTFIWSSGEFYHNFYRYVLVRKRKCGVGLCACSVCVYDVSGDAGESPGSDPQGLYVKAHFACVFHGNT